MKLEFVIDHSKVNIFEAIGLSEDDVDKLFDAAFNDTEGLSCSQVLEKAIGITTSQKELIAIVMVWNSIIYNYQSEINQNH
jgi:hypothetical protein